MDIDTPIKCLGAVDTAPLRDCLLAQERGAWLEHAFRQKAYDVHRYTESIVMVFTDGDGWPDIEISRQPGWDRLAAAAVPLMRALIGAHYPPGGTIIRAMAAKLVAGAKITTHRDTHPSFHYGHRIHVPITTNPRVRFTIDGRPYPMEVGQAYEINNQKKHSVMNKGKEDRITFIFDYVPAEYIERVPG